MTEDFEDDVPPIADLSVVGKLTKDLRIAAEKLSDAEARYIVDLYYELQRSRIRATNQVRAAGESAEPHALVIHLASQFKSLEGQMKAALGRYAQAQPMGPWLLGIRGIGPVLASGILAHIDIQHCKTAGDIWAFAGYDPTRKWDKGQKRPWNANLKVIGWKIGESFVKTGGFYREMYDQRKAYETAKNIAGDYADQCRQRLDDAKKRKVSLDKGLITLLETGRLPDKAVHERSKRWAVKLFMAHYLEVAYPRVHGTEMPAPFAIARLGHAHPIKPPSSPED